MRKNTPPIRNIFSSKATTGSGTVVSVSDWKHIVLQIGTASSANLTLKIQGSISDTAPDFSSAATSSNHWDYVGAYDLNTGLFVSGDTGFVVAGTDDFVNYGVNVDGIKWLCATVTAISAGSVTVNAGVFDNE